METMTSSSPPWWSKDTVAVVTGANKGVGYEIVRLLAEKGLTVVLTARDSGRGQAALDALKTEGQKSVWFHPLDVQSLESVATLATWLKSKFGGIDILVNNAAIIAFGTNGDFSDYESAKAIMETNFYGVKHVTQRLLPLLRPSPAAARIINVTSNWALYQRLRTETLKQKFRDEDNYSEELFDSLAANYLDDVKAGRVDKERWVEAAGRTGPMYTVSKLLLNAYSRLLARELATSQSEEHQIFVASFTPGRTMTDLVRRLMQEGHRVPPDVRANTPAEGADTGVWLALLPKEELAKKNGKFFHNRKEFGFGDLQIGTVADR